MAKRRMMVQIMPRVIFRFPSTISAGCGGGDMLHLTTSPLPPPCAVALVCIPRLAPTRQMLKHFTSKGFTEHLLGARACASTVGTFALYSHSCEERMVVPMVEMRNRAPSPC